MKSNYFHRQIELMNICLDKMSLFKNNKYSEFFKDLANIIFKEIIHEALFADCKMVLIDKFNRTFYYIRTENINDKLHNQIIKIIDKSNSYKEISAKIKELGYKIPDDVIII